MRRKAFASGRAREVKMRRSDFSGDTSGSMAIVASVFFTLMLFVAALTLEASHLYVVKLQTQRAADIANLAAASTPSPIKGTTPSTMAVATAANIAEINGYGSAEIRVTAEASPTSNGAMALVTNIVKDSPLNLGRLLSHEEKMPVNGVSWANLGAVTGDCVRSTNGAIIVYGNGEIAAPSCNFNSAMFLGACGNAKIEAAKINIKYARQFEAPLICSSASVTPSLNAFNFEQPAVDPMESNAKIVAIKARLQKMGSPGWPYANLSPSTPLLPFILPGTNQNFSNATATLLPIVRYGQIVASGSTLTFAGTGTADTKCSAPTTISGTVSLAGATRLRFGSGCFAFGDDVSTAPGATVAFEIESGASATLVFKKGIINNSGTLTFGNATISMFGILSNEKGGTVRFGDGKVTIGAGIINGTGTVTFGNGPLYANYGLITNGRGDMTFGDGPFHVWGTSVINAENGSLTFGNGPFYFYDSTVTNSRGRMTFGNGPFEFRGGSLWLHAQSDTSFGVGDLNFYGGSAMFGGENVTLGRGGSAATGGSSLFIFGGVLSLTGKNMTAIGTTIAVSAGTVNLLGSGTIHATAPTGDHPSYGYQNVLFMVASGAFSLYQPTAVEDILSGLIYAPLSIASMYGKQTVTYPEGGCLEIVAGTVDVHDDAKASFLPCTGISAMSSGKAMLVQ